MSRNVVSIAVAFAMIVGVSMTTTQSSAEAGLFGKLRSNNCCAPAVQVCPPVKKVCGGGLFSKLRARAAHSNNCCAPARVVYCEPAPVCPPAPCCKPAKPCCKPAKPCCAQPQPCCPQPKPCCKPAKPCCAQPQPCCGSVVVADQGCGAAGCADQGCADGGCAGEVIISEVPVAEADAAVEDAPPAPEAAE